LCFRSAEGKEQTAVGVASDGSVWVVDRCNNRMLRFRPGGSTAAQSDAQIAYLPAVYTATVDHGNPQRVFANFLEFEVERNAPLAAGKSWKLVRNWLIGLPAALRDERAVNGGFGGFTSVETLANGRTYGNTAFVCGDAGLVMAGLAQRLRGRIAIDPDFAADFAENRRRALAEYRETLGPYADFPAELRRALPRDALWVRDITISNSSWGNRIFPVYGPRDAVHPISAAIGPGLPMGIGAAMAGNGRKASALVGDGGVAMYQTELWTAVQERAELVIMVMNDRGYGVIKHIQGALQDGRMFFGDLLGPDLQKLAAVAGLPSFKVSRAEDLADTVAQEVAISGGDNVQGPDGGSGG
jgi:hypothetical protein